MTRHKRSISTSAFLTVFLMLSAVPALANWTLEQGIATATPDDTDSNIVQLELGCGDPYYMSVFTPHGAVLRRDGSGNDDYFYEVNRIKAVIDGETFPLVAAGSGDGVVLFGEGVPEENYLADLSDDMIQAMRSGHELLLTFDISHRDGAQGSPALIVSARFELDSAHSVLEEALQACLP